MSVPLRRGGLRACRPFPSCTGRPHDSTGAEVRHAALERCGGECPCAPELSRMYDRNPAEARGAPSPCRPKPRPPAACHPPQTPPVQDQLPGRNGKQCREVGFWWRVGGGERALVYARPARGGGWADLPTSLNCSRRAAPLCALGAPSGACSHACLLLLIFSCSFVAAVGARGVSLAAGCGCRVPARCASLRSARATTAPSAIHPWRASALAPLLPAPGCPSPGPWLSPWPCAACVILVCFVGRGRVTGRPCRRGGPAPVFVALRGPLWEGEEGAVTVRGGGSCPWHPSAFPRRPLHGPAAATSAQCICVVWVDAVSGRGRHSLGPRDGMCCGVGGGGVLPPSTGRLGGLHLLGGPCTGLSPLPLPRPPPPLPALAQPPGSSC
jgi:hypothetical protein